MTSGGTCRYGLVREMSEADLRAAQRDALIPQHGYRADDFNE